MTRRGGLAAEGRVMFAFGMAPMGVFAVRAAVAFLEVYNNCYGLPQQCSLAVYLMA